MAYVADRLSDPDKAYDYLLCLRRATVLESVQTTKGNELLKPAEKAGIDRSLLLQHLKDGSAEEAYRADEKHACACAVHTLPAYRICCGSRERMIRYLADAGTFIRVIDDLTEEKRCI